MEIEAFMAKYAWPVIDGGFVCLASSQVLFLGVETGILSLLIHQVGFHVAKEVRGMPTSKKLWVLLSFQNNQINQ